MVKKKDAEETFESEPEAQPDPTPEPEAPAITVDPTKHILVDDVVVEAPLDEQGRPMVKARRLMLNGRNLEHTHDHESGAWCYQER